MEVIRFAILGLASGAIYALLALGLVLIYRGSGLLNFSQGAMAMFGAYAYYELSVKRGLGQVPSVALTLILCALLGASFDLIVLRAMRRRNASSLSRVIATLSLLLILQSVAVIVYGVYPLAVPSLLPTGTTTIFSSEITLTADRLYIIGICLALGAGLFALYRWSSFGRVTAAVAEDELAAASFGYSPNRIAAINWALGSALAGVAGILFAPILFLQPLTLTLLVIPALAAGLIGGFRSFPIVLAAALGLGLIQSEITRYVDAVGWSTAAPLILVVAFLAVRGTSLPLRSFVLDRLPSVGTGRVRPWLVGVVWLVAVLLTSSVDANWNQALTITFGTGIVCLSIVLLTGYAGQLSLAQYVIAGVGALIAAKLMQHMGLIPALLVASLATGAVGAAVGLPALRTRGATFAVTTLCLGSAIVAVVFSNSGWTGGLGGIEVPSLDIFGWSIDPIDHPGRYTFVVASVLILLALAVTNLRRGVIGRRLLAVRSNERAAASLGVPVAGTKVYAFFVAAVIASVGGILLAFLQPSVQPSNFDVFTSVLLVGLTVIAGIGFACGSVVGAALIAGGVIAELLSGWSSAAEYLPLIGAVGLLTTLMTQPDGLLATVDRFARAPMAALDRGEAAIRSRLPFGRRPERPRNGAIEVPQRKLVVEEISVSFGGVRAVDAVSLEVLPGEVHGLIGPNGAGKTTLIDAITGFANPDSGEIRLGDRQVGGWTPRRRALAGLSRSFQSLELFGDLTVEENLAVACEPVGGRRYLTDLLRPGRIALSPAAQQAVRSFHLEELLAVKPDSISFGRRKEVAIARSIAGLPSVLLLDEPAAGLMDNEADDLATLIRRLADEWKIGVLLVEHKVDLILSICDRVTVMDAGRRLTTGTPEEIKRHPEVLDAYLGALTA
jgi:ABC-type branched-subunit amino acid transport system ATPase component/ABC-type branched-subunit amino acid transport system permease subunit